MRHRAASAGCGSARSVRKARLPRCCCCCCCCRAAATAAAAAPPAPPLSQLVAVDGHAGAADHTRRQVQMRGSPRRNTPAGASHVAPPLLPAVAPLTPQRGALVGPRSSLEPRKGRESSGGGAEPPLSAMHPWWLGCCARLLRAAMQRCCSAEAAARVLSAGRDSYGGSQRRRFPHEGVRARTRRTVGPTPSGPGSAGEPPACTHSPVPPTQQTRTAPHPQPPPQQAQPPTAAAATHSSCSSSPAAGSAVNAPPWP